MLGSLRSLIDKTLVEILRWGRGKEKEGNSSFRMVMNHEHRVISVMKRLANLSSFYFFHML